MSLRLGLFAVLVCVATGTQAKGQFYGTGGFGNSGLGGQVTGYGYGSPAFYSPFATFPYPNGGYVGNYYSGPGSLNPLFGLGLTPLAVQSALSEISLRRPSPSTVSLPSNEVVTVPAGDFRTYTYRIYRR